MNRKQRALLAKEMLEQLYPDPPIPLDHHDPFTLLVAVLLSAQCTDKMVNRVTPRLWSLAKTPREMSQLAEGQILEVIRQLGLAPRKSRAIRELSQILLEQYQGVVPADFTALESLPGVGHKTASVVMCQAFGVPAFPVDTHIHRLAQRWGLTSGQNVVQTEKDLKKLFPQESWNKLHLQIIYYGREHCTARECNGTVCSICRALYPNRQKPVQTKK
jgi:endonuclease III